jgi:hypothetical protein
MTLRRLLRESFSPYEIAVMGRAISLALGALAMAAWFPHPTRVTSFAFGVGALLFLLTLVTTLMWDEFSRCPTCAKSPFERAKGEVGLFLPTTIRGHIWPESQCSECGTALDTRP